MLGRLHKCGRLLGVEALAVASIAGGLIGLVGGEPAGAASRPLAVRAGSIWARHW